VPDAPYRVYFLAAGAGDGGVEADVGYRAGENEPTRVPCSVTTSLVLCLCVHPTRVYTIHCAES
jgi:hypothetical protein